MESDLERIINSRYEIHSYILLIYMDILIMLFLLIRQTLSDQHIQFFLYQVRYWYIWSS